MTKRILLNIWIRYKGFLTLIRLTKKVNTLIAVKLFCVFCAVLATACIKAFFIQLYS